MMPPITIPKEINASATKCKNALFIFKSFSLSLKKKNAEIPFMIVPTTATMAIVFPGYKKH